MFNFQHSIKQKIIWKIYQSEEIENIRKKILMEIVIERKLKEKYI